MHKRMDWRAINFDWNKARGFLVAAEEGSFSAAARALGMAQPTIGRQVSALEEELGITLFQRSGSRLELTEAGLELLEHVRAMGEAATRVSLSATGQSAAIDGKVVITASQLISAFLLPPVLARLRQSHPGVTIELVASNELRDLRRREADIAIRNVASTQPDLIARKLRVARARGYATPDYLASIGGDLTDPACLARAEFFGFAETAHMIAFMRGRGTPVTAANFPIVADNHLVQWEMCKRGMGICILMEEVGDPEPAVVRAQPADPGIELPIWLTSHRELQTSRRIRIVFDLLAEMLS